MAHEWCPNQSLVARMEKVGETILLFEVVVEWNEGEDVDDWRFVYKWTQGCWDVGRRDVAK